MLRGGMLSQPVDGLTETQPTGGPESQELRLPREDPVLHPDPPRRCDTQFLSRRCVETGRRQFQGYLPIGLTGPSPSRAASSPLRPGFFRPAPLGVA
jgi:hypothetical protein